MLPWKRKPKKARESGLPEGVPVPEHVSDLWHILQKIAAEEDPRFENQSIVEHSQSQGAEGVRDVSRWLEIYRQRVNPKYRYRFPEHHPRHRGYCLIQRSWPGGLRWEAFDEDTLMRLAVPPQPDREGLVREIDDHLRSRSGA